MFVRVTLASTISFVRFAEKAESQFFAKSVHHERCLSSRTIFKLNRAPFLSTGLVSGGHKGTAILFLFGGCFKLVWQDPPKPLERLVRIRLTAPQPIADSSLSLRPSDKIARYHLVLIPVA